MRLVSFKKAGRIGLAASQRNGPFCGWFVKEDQYPGDLSTLVERGATGLAEAGERLLAGPEIDLSDAEYLPPLPHPGKIICIGLNYADHSAESGFAVPSYPTVFARFASSLIGHEAPIILPRVSHQLDYEAEFVAVIGKGGRNIAKADALDHVIGYALFNDASIRDYQLRTPQWTVGKNFDGTGPFGPWLMTSDDLPPGCAGLRLQARLNGQIVQDASTNDLVFDVATLVSTLSEAFTLSPGDIIVTGTPSGVGLARKPQLWMKAGDVCEVDLEGYGVLRNVIAAER